jgi:phosphatidylglycerophosphate synthase
VVRPVGPANAFFPGVRPAEVKELFVDLRYPVTRYLYRPLSLRAAALLAPTFVTPIQLTWVSAVLFLAGSIAFGMSEYVVGAVIILVGEIIDCVDGDLARITGRTSRWGAFLDSVLDRWADAALILGLGYSDMDSLGGAAGLALVASFLVSYTRARAQSLGVDCPDGIGGRDARVLVLVIAALLDLVLAGLITIIVLGVITSIHRMIVAGREMERLERESVEMRTEA